MTMNPDGVIECFNVFKNKHVCMPVIGNGKSVKPFSFN